MANDPVAYQEQLIGQVGLDEDLLNNEMLRPLAFARRLIVDGIKGMFSQEWWGPNNTCRNPFIFKSKDGDNAPDSLLHIHVEQAEEQTLEDGRYYIIVASGPTAFERTAIGNFAGNMIATPSDRGDYTAMVSSSVNITCKAKKWPKAELLAQYVALFLLFFQPILRHRSAAFSVGNPTVSAKQISDDTGSQSQRNDYVVSMPVSMSLTWTLADENMDLLRKIATQEGFPPNCV